MYGLRHSESLFGNYHAYLCDARAKLQACAASCVNWVYPYDGESPHYEAFSVPSPEKREDSPSNSRSEDKQISSNGDSDVLSSLETVTLGELSSTQSRSERQSGNELCENSEVNGMSNPSKAEGVCEGHTEKSQLSAGNDLSLPSVGESSGYESFALKCSSDSSPENEPSDDTAAVLEDENPQPISNPETSKNTVPHLPGSKETSKMKIIQEVSYMDVFKTTPSIGMDSPFSDSFSVRSALCIMSDCDFQVHS